MQVFAGMNLIAEVNAVMLKHIQHRQPAPGQLGECLVEQRFMVRRPGVEPGPRKRAGKRRVCAQTEFFRGRRRTLQRGDSPVGAPGGIATQCCWRKIIKCEVVYRVHRHQLPFKMGRQLADLQSETGQHSPDIITIRLADRCLFKVENSGLVTGDLQRPISQRGGPPRKTRQRIKRRL